MKECHCEHDSHFGGHHEGAMIPLGHVYGAILKTSPILTSQGVVQKCYYCRTHHTILQPTHGHPKED